MSEEYIKNKNKYTIESAISIICTSKYTMKHCGISAKEPLINQ